MDITIKIDLSDNTIKALHEVAEAITQPKGVRVSLNELADAADNLRNTNAGDWVPQDTRYTGGENPGEPAEAEPEPEQPAKEEEKKPEPAKKPAAKKATPKKPAEPAKEEAKAPTKDDVTKALTALMEAKGGDKAEAMALVKKHSTNGKLSGVDPEKYADIIAAVEEAING
ncbi:hypothetical protein [Veillonella sp.]|uniref:hypothetical protein n=1 Tax=Veillonella sp. TaxID=1926307 RepID=UPI0025D07C6D|nr:hypothetical protein [Veillonella sp.]